MSIHPFTEESLAWPGNGSPTMYVTISWLTKQLWQEISKQFDSVIHGVLNVRLSLCLAPTISVAFRIMKMCPYPENMDSYASVEILVIRHCMSEVARGCLKWHGFFSIVHGFSSISKALQETKWEGSQCLFLLLWQKYHDQRRKNCWGHNSRLCSVVLRKLGSRNIKQLVIWHPLSKSKREMT